MSSRRFAALAALAAVALIVLAAIFLPGKPPPAVPLPPAHAMVTDDLDLGGGEHLRVVEIPDRIMPYRCVILTSGGHSQIHCPVDAAAPGP